MRINEVFFPYMYYFYMYCIDSRSKIVYIYPELPGSAQVIYCKAQFNLLLEIKRKKYYFLFLSSKTKM